MTSLGIQLDQMPLRAMVCFVQIGSPAVDDFVMHHRDQVLFNPISIPLQPETPHYSLVILPLAR